MSTLYMCNLRHALSLPLLSKLSSQTLVITTGSTRPLFGYYATLVQDLNQACNLDYTCNENNYAVGDVTTTFDPKYYTSCVDERCTDEDIPPTNDAGAEVSSDDIVRAINLDHAQNIII